MLSNFSHSIHRNIFTRLRSSLKPLSHINTSSISLYNGIPTSSTLIPLSGTLSITSFNSTGFSICRSKSSYSEDDSDYDIPTYNRTYNNKKTSSNYGDAVDDWGSTSSYSKSTRGFSYGGEPRNSFRGSNRSDGFYGSPNRSSNYGGQERGTYSGQERGTYGGSYYGSSRSGSSHGSNSDKNFRNIPQFSFQNNPYVDTSKPSNSSYEQPQLTQVVFSKELPSVVKNCYTESEITAALTDSEVSEWRKKHSIEILGGDCPKPVLSFEATSFPPYVVNALMKKFSEPSPIQSQGWALAGSGRDMIGSAQTGSGKTIAFALPALEHIRKQPTLPISNLHSEKPIVLILAPTRELALQIDDEFKKFTRFYNVRTACLHGGSGNRREQLRQVMSKPQVVIATPGRLIDFVSQGMLSLDRVSFVVLDEADRMLDMGFEPQVRNVMTQIRPERQMLMWSATWPNRVQDLARAFLDNPIRIRVGSDELTANPLVTQTFDFGPMAEKLPKLFTLLQDQMTKTKILIFTSTKIACEFLENDLVRRGIRTASLHGDKQQGERNKILYDFKSGNSRVLVATDVAARGIDVKDIGLVVNWNMPKNVEDYVHRIGRTARAGSSGTSISFFTQDDAGLIPELITLLKDAGQEVPKPFLEHMEALLAKKSRQSMNHPPKQRKTKRYG